MLPKEVNLVLSLVASFLLSYQVIYCLSVLKNTVSPEIYLTRIALCLAAFIYPILGGWLSYGLIGGGAFACFAFIMVLLAASIARTSYFIWFPLEYGLFCFFLFRMQEYFENQIAGMSVDREKRQNEKNDLDMSYRLKGEGISILFEKYSTYYHLRKFAEELTTTLSVSQLTQMVAAKCMEFIPRGELALLSLADSDGRHLSVMAFKGLESAAKQVHKQGDLFDSWVIRNRKRLIVANTHQDFRFDVSETTRRQELKSLVIVPLFHEGRVIGTLRINSAKPDTFTNDDLRLLDAMATLTSSALSNAMLYEQTEQLAIRDSLTGLYVRRYFFERMKEEHRRTLMMNRSLSFLMCDLDHFKNTNDQFGHQAGDLMLIRFAEILKETAENAVVSRYGGEEFAILLPEIEKKEAEAVAEAIRKKVDETPFSIRREKIHMTVSIGVSSMPKDTLDIETLVQKADQALYQAKRTGRNRVCSAVS